MSNLVCPYCGQLLQQPEGYNTDVVACPKHMLNYNLSTRIISIEERKAPQYMKDSLILMNRIVKGDVWLSYGPNDLFTEGFKLENTVQHVTNDNSKRNRLPQEGDVLISFNRWIARYLKGDFPILLAFGDTHPEDSALGDVSIQSTNSALLLDLTRAQYKSEMTFEQHRALTAFVTDTAAATAAVLLNRSSSMFSDWTPSQLLMSFIYGDKSDICASFTAESIVRNIADTIIDHAKFCNIDRLPKLRSSVKLNKFLERLSIPQMQGLLESEFNPEKLLLPGNDWVFWRGNIQAACSNTINNCDTWEAFDSIVYVGSFMAKAYELWGIKYTLDEEFLQKAKSLVGDSDPTALYMTYWNIVSHRLEEMFK